MAKRKYFSEFGLNMFGSFTLLLQQESLHTLSDYPIFRENPCHIYMITRRPRVSLDVGTFQVSDDFVQGTFLFQRGNTFEPHQFRLRNHLGTSQIQLECSYPHTEFIIRDGQGNILSSGKTAFLAQHVPQLQPLLKLEVLYIGQSYGVEGARLAPERLQNHATLQGIYAEAIRRSPDQEIWMVLWSFEQVILMHFDPNEEEYGTSDEEDDNHISRVAYGEITEQQQINFTEAALIRYFQPEYNTIYKNSFPNPAHSTYSQCYDLDLNMVMVELQTDQLGCELWSPSVKPQSIHFVRFPLHSPEERKRMFLFE